MKGLTEKQAEILQLIIDFQAEHKISPTYRNMADKLDVHVKSVYDQVKAVEKKGYISITPNISRSIVVLKGVND